MNKLQIVPRGDVTNTYTWENHEVQFYSGKKQKVRRRIHPKREMAFTVMGDKETMNYLQEFYDYHKGYLDSFLFDYDGQELTCNFASKISIKQSREVSNIVGFSADISLIVQTSAVAPTINDNDTFSFHPRGTITDTTDWNTNVIDMFSKQTEQTWEHPIHTFSIELTGDKADRDKLLAFYLKNGDFNEVRFTNNNTDYFALMPSSLSIVDKRELNTIIGYTCSFDLVSTNSEVSLVDLSDLHSFVIGVGSQLTVSQPHAFTINTPKVALLTVSQPHAFILYEKE